VSPCGTPKVLTKITAPPGRPDGIETDAFPGMTSSTS
jgi:hypothetical protein